MRIFITGSAGCLSAALLPALCNDPIVESIFGIDLKPTAFKHPKLTTEIFDMRNLDLRRKMEWHDAVIHLGFKGKRIVNNLEAMYDNNVLGSYHVVDAAKANGIRKFINVSSSSVYGSGESLREENSVKPSRALYYAQHKAEIEAYIARNLPSAIQFRSRLIIGAKAQDFLRDMFIKPIWLDFQNPPRQQVIHENDVVRAILMGLKADTSGFFNLAAPEVFDMGGTYIKKGIEEGRLIRRMPFDLYKKMARVSDAMRIGVPIDMTMWVDILGSSITLNCDRAKEFLGWVPMYDHWEARRDAMAKAWVYN